MTDPAATTRRSILQAAIMAAAVLPPSREAAAQSGGKTLTLAIPSNPNTLDPINAVLQDPMVINQCIFENLIASDVDGNLQPQLAKALPEISADKLTYTFDLRDDVLFQNGKALHAEDVKYSFDSMLDPKRNAARRALFERIESVRIDTPRRVQVKLSRPYAPWLSFLTKYMGIWPAGSREALGDEYFKLRPKGIGTGPGIFEEWRPNESVTLVRNPHYWRTDLPHWDRLVVKFIAEDSTRVAYLLSRQADIIGSPPPRDFETLKKRSGMAGDVRSTLGGWTMLMTNSRKPPFDDVNFRRAVAYAIDRDMLAKRAFFGMVDPCTVPAPPAGWWYDAPADHVIRYDPEQARGFLKASKYADDATFTMTLPATPYILDLKDAAVAIQSQLQAVGIHATLQMGEPLTVLGQSKQGALQALLFNLTSPGEPTYAIAQHFAAGQASSGSSGYTNPQVDRLLDAAYAENDQSKLKPIYAALMRIMAEDCPYVWLGFFKSANLWRSGVKDFKVNQGITMDVSQVSPN